MSDRTRRDPARRGRPSPDPLTEADARRIRDTTLSADPFGAEDTHASASGAAASGALTGGVIGAATGPLGAVVGALGGAAMGVAAERAMHSDEPKDVHLDRTRRYPVTHDGEVVDPGLDRGPVKEEFPSAELVPERTIPLREEQLVAHKELQETGEVVIRTVVEETPGRLEVEALREEIEVEHVPVQQVVSERRAPWEEENGDLVVPVYEEQLVVVKRLVMKEQLRIRRVSAREHQVFEDSLQRERLVVEDPESTGLVRELYARGDEEEGQQPSTGRSHKRRDSSPEGADEGFLSNLVKRALT